jgi:hypothetical protein
MDSKSDNGYMQQSTWIQTHKSRSFSSQVQFVGVIDVITGATEALRNGAAPSAARLRHPFSLLHNERNSKYAINIGSDSKRNMI